MKYYLETNALRKLNSKLFEIKNECYTSSLSIIELISGINEKQFEIRKKVISNLILSNFNINWDFPEKIKIESFPSLDFEEGRVNDLKKLCEYLIESKDLDAFVSVSRELYHNLDFFRTLDSDYSKDFIDATESGNDELKAIYSREKKLNGKFYEDHAKKYVKSLPQASEFNESLTLFGIVVGVAEYLELNSGENTINKEKLFNEYNGNIDAFIESFSLYSGLKQAELNSPAKNDYVDLHHLLYLGNGKKSKTVTDDKLLLKITGQVLNTKGFIDIISE